MKVMVINNKGCFQSPELTFRRLILLLCLLSFFSSCQKEKKNWGSISFSSPVKIIFDTDMLTDCDDAAALGILHKLADNGESEILATMITSSHPMSAPVVEAINTYYKRKEIPIGVPKNGLGVYRSHSVFLDSVALEFPHTLKSNDDAPDAVSLYRQILRKQPDHSVVILTVGYMSNLKPLLQSESDNYSSLNGMELVKQKVKVWICMGGNFPIDDASDNVNFTRDSTASVYTLTHWPGEIVFVGREIGHTIFAGDRLKETSLDNPIRRAYQLHRERDRKSHWNHHTADLAAVMFAVRGLNDYWSISPAGYVDIKKNCSFAWKTNPAGKQKYIIQKMDRVKFAHCMESLLIQPPK
jgi:inosine-uridine nucleoside N-ribohydrolase